MKLFITGGCGFIGSHLIRESLRRGFEVVNYDALTYAAGVWDSTIPERSTARLLDVAQHPRYQFIEGDIMDSLAVAAAMRGCTHVLHLAAESHVDRGIQDATPFVRTNVEGTQVLLDIARMQGVTRFLYASTDEVYGSWDKQESGAWSERIPLAPRNPYAASKAAGEHLVRAAQHTHGFPVVISRGCNTYGPAQHGEKFIPRAIRAILNEHPIPVYGDGENVREWLHVYDHVRGLLRILLEGGTGETYNIAGGYFLRNIILAERIIALMGRGSVALVTDRPGHDGRYASNGEKLYHIGWKPTMEFDTGLADTVAWYRHYWKNIPRPEIAWEKQLAS